MERQSMKCDKCSDNARWEATSPEGEVFHFCGDHWMEKAHQLGMDCNKGLLPEIAELCQWGCNKETFN